MNLPNASSRSQLAFRFYRPFYLTKYFRTGETPCFLVTRSARIVSTSLSRELSAYCWYPSCRGLQCRAFLPTDFSLPLRILSPCRLATSTCSHASLPYRLALGMTWRWPIIYIEPRRASSSAFSFLLIRALSTFLLGHSLVKCRP